MSNYRAPNLYGTTSTMDSNAAWLVGVIVILIVFSIFALVMFRRNHPGSGFGSSCKSSTPAASVGFHQSLDNNTIPPYTVTLGTSFTDIARNATIISLVDCAIVTDTPGPTEVQRVKVLQDGVYVIEINSVIAAQNSTSLLTMQMDLSIPNVTLGEGTIPFAAVNVSANQQASIHTSYITTLNANSLVTIQMLCDHDNEPVSIYSWDVNLFKLR
jgi:hypothetical protein